MRRRSAGLLMVTTVLIAVALLAQVNRNHHVAGSAAAEPVPGPPQPGYCLLETPPVGGGWGSQGQLYPALRLEPCRGLRWGEVVVVVPGGLTAATNVETTDAYGSDVVENPLQTRCAEAQSAYLSGGRQPLKNWVNWYWQMGVITAVGPTAHQRAAGQSWIACVITPDFGIAATQYGGAVKGFVVDGTLPAAFATCAATVQDVESTFISQNPIARVSCALGHRVEILGTSGRLPAVLQSQLDETCAELSRWLTRMPDPTAAGLLVIHAVASHPDATTGLPVPGVGGNGSATCIVEPVGHRELKGSLVGLGAGAIPWS